MRLDGHFYAEHVLSVRCWCCYHFRSRRACCRTSPEDGAACRLVSRAREYCFGGGCSSPLSPEADLDLGHRELIGCGSMSMEDSECFMGTKRQLPLKAFDYLPIRSNAGPLKSHGAHGGRALRRCNPRSLWVLHSQS